MLWQWHKLSYKSSVLDLDLKLDLTCDLNLTWGELVLVITGEGKGLYIQIAELHCTIRQQNDAIWQDKRLCQLNDKARECRILMGKLRKNRCTKIGVKLGGYDGSLGALNAAKYPSCLPLSCQWIHFSPKNMYGSGEPSESTSSPMAYDLLRAGWDCMVWSRESGGSWGCWECNWFWRLTCAS